MEKPSEYIDKWEIKGHFGRDFWYLLNDSMVLETKDGHCLPETFDYFWQELTYFRGWETQQLQDLAQKSDFSENLLSESSLKKKRFYQFIDFQYFTPRNYTFIEAYFGQSEIELQIRPPHISFVYTSNNYKQIQTWAEFWFLGPQIPLVDFEIRKDLREWIFSFIHPESGLNLADAYPLLDYNKIQPREWRFIEDDGYSGSEVKLEKDRIYYASWDRGGGGGNIISLENFYTRWQKYTQISVYEREYILAELEKAIIL